MACGRLRRGRDLHARKSATRARLCACTHEDSGLDAQKHEREEVKLHEGGDHDRDWAETIRAIQLETSVVVRERMQVVKGRDEESGVCPQLQICHAKVVR